MSKFKLGTVKCFIFGGIDSPAEVEPTLCNASALQGLTLPDLKILKFCPIKILSCRSRHAIDLLYVVNHISSLSIVSWQVTKYMHGNPRKFTYSCDIELIPTCLVPKHNYLL